MRLTVVSQVISLYSNPRLDDLSLWRLAMYLALNNEAVQYGRLRQQPLDLQSPFKRGGASLNLFVVRGRLLTTYNSLTMVELMARPIYHTTEMRCSGNAF